MKTKRKLNINKYELFEKPVNNFQYSSSKLFLGCSDSFWHNGIHLKLNGDVIKNIYDGTIVACRFSSGFKTQDINFDKFKIYPEMLENFNLSPGNFFIYNFFELKDGKYQLKEEFKSEKEENKIIQELIKKEIGKGYSNSFVLIEHKTEKVVLENNTSRKIQYQFYTLYNHLRPLKYYTNKEKCDLFFYSADLEFTNTFPHNYVKGYYVLENLRLQRQEFIKIPSETKISETDYYKYTFNGKTENAYIDEKLVRNLTSHYETRRPAFTNSEKNDSNYLKPGEYRTITNEIFLFDNIKKIKRCVKSILTIKDKIEINYDDFITYLKDTDENNGLKISSLNGYIFFSKTIKDTLKTCLTEYNSWDLKNNPKPNITYNIKNGFLLTGRYTPSGQKEYYYLQQNKSNYIPDVECHYIQAKKLKSNSEYAIEYIYIPCELKIKETESPSTVFKKVEYYFNGSKQKCYIANDSFRKFQDHWETKRRLRPYESTNTNDISNYLPRKSHNVIDDILIFDTNDISKRLAIASVPKTTKFQISKTELDNLLKNLADNTSANKFEKGIFVNYDTGSTKGSGYIYLPWGYDLSNENENQVASNFKKLKENVKNISETLNKWLNEFYQKEEISFNEFKLKLNKDERIPENQIYSYKGSGESIKLEKGDVLGYGGYAAVSPDEKKDIYKIEDYIHFETFCTNTDFMNFNKNRNDYKADFLIKSETSVHKNNPVAETIIKPLEIVQINYNLNNSLDNLNNSTNSLLNFGKKLISNSLFKPKFVQAIELSNETLDSCYLRVTGKKVSFIESEIFIEMEYMGYIGKLEDDEYISKKSFIYTWKDPYYISNEDKTIKVFKKKGSTFEDTGKTINIYNTFKYEWRSQIGDTYRQIHYYCIPASKKEKFYINEKTINEKMELFSLIKDNDYYKLKEEKKILQTEIFEKPKDLIWSESAEIVKTGTYENTHEEITDKQNKTWILGKEPNGSNTIWINKDDIDDTIDTNKPVEEIIYDKWEDFFEEIKLSDFGKYRCENKEKLLAELNINKTNDEELKYTLNKNQELVSSLFFKNTSEWKQDSGLMDAYKKAWPYSDMDYLKQQRDDYCFWENTSLSSKSNVTFFHPVKFIGLMDKIELYNSNAKLLYDIQNIVVHLNNMRPTEKTKLGIWGNQTGTFCNQAVYLTIRAFDKNYKNYFVKKDNDKIPDSISDLPENSVHKTEYEHGLWPSNVWCDVLEYLSDKEKETGIVKVSETEAKKLANQGFLVIASWKNTIDIPNKAHPHFATVSPNFFNKNISETELILANVGGSCQFTTIKGANGKVGAFGNKSGICFYYNKKQIPRNSIDESKNFPKNRGYCDSLAKMISDWGMWSNSNDVWNWEDRL